MFPMWVYFIVAASIGVIAFGIGHFIPGLGVAFVAVASTVWVAYSMRTFDRGDSG